MSNNIKKEVYIHEHFNGNEISNAVLKENIIHNSSFNNRPIPNVGEKKGLLYYNSDIDRIMVWDGNVWKIVKYLDDNNYKVYNGASGSQLSQTYELPLLGLISRDNELLNISLNGVELLNDTYSIQPDGLGDVNLVIDTDLLGYIIDTTPPEDYIQLNYLTY